MTSIDITIAATPANPSPASGSPRRKAKTRSANSPAANGAPSKPTAKETLPISTSAIVIKLLSRAKGAMVAELMADTAWQPHSVRAYFSGLRKKGHVLVREPRKGGEHAYRIRAPAADVVSAVQIGEGPPESDRAAPAAANTGA